MKIDLKRIKQRLFDDEAVRSIIASDFGLETIPNDSEGFAEAVIKNLDQVASPDPFRDEISNQQVFRAVVRALGSNSRKWECYLKHERRLEAALCGFDLAELSKRDINRAEIKQCLCGQTSSGDAAAIVKWASFLLIRKHYYRELITLAYEFLERGKKFNLSDSHVILGVA